MPAAIEAYQYRCYRVAIFDNGRSAEQNLADRRAVGWRRDDQFPAPATGSRPTMSIDDQKVKRFFRGEKRKAEKAVNVAKRDIKRTVNDVENAFRAPWYKRMWSKFFSILSSTLPALQKPLIRRFA
ncbi:hypothetical protein Y032_0251g170 [Ancylostoma ceylanicum]|uniref:Uncharacterized protein n=1 Tax=Ancylostoma ceylanicum TaxID=53326 RepID=A0A016SCQ7_9BILA|nr:hypothetical protein Y032_0251g170 [Ancylostoma ceylanicum]